MTKAAPHILIVDDEADLCELLTLRLTHEGFRATACATARDALAVLERNSIDAVLLDLRLEEDDGMDLLSLVLERSAELPVIMLTAHGTTETAVEAMKRGAYGFLTKPFDDHELVQELRHAVEHSSLKREVASLRRVVGGVSSVRLLGTSAPISRVREILARAAPTDATLLVLGESGTGKELAARTLHELSERKGGPFVAVNCGALPAELLESELFGHVRGAFTGATKDKEGLFAAAHGGTLFLDEIGDAPPEVQVKLLRALQERAFLPVGATELRSVDVRIVAATNHDLWQSVHAGRFRQDLYYRLHVVPVTMPPLRERPDDIPVLAEVFLARACARHHLPRPSITEAAMAMLTAHDWPGNVRELSNAIEAAAVMSRDGTLTPTQLEGVLSSSRSARTSPGIRPAAFQHTGGRVGGSPSSGAPLGESQRGAGGAPPSPISATFALPTAAPPTAASPGAGLPSAAQPDILPLREAKEAFEREYLRTVMQRCQGNVTAAARLAGRNRSDFHELLRRHDIRGASFRPASDLDESPS